MSAKTSIETIIEEKRAEMMKCCSAKVEDVNISNIYKAIQNIASEMTLEPTEQFALVIRELDAAPFFRVGDNEFVYMLYRDILKVEPDPDGYMHHMKLLLFENHDRKELIDSFLSIAEIYGQKVILVGLDDVLKKRKIMSRLKRIPILGYICNWFVNIILLPKRIESLYKTVCFLQAKIEMK